MLGKFLNTSEPQFPHFYNKLKHLLQCLAHRKHSINDYCIIIIIIVIRRRYNMADDPMLEILLQFYP